tara:strand:+ start:2004 stop:2588 length:585 start_codon:yes stop_codon:yes gene_type:complete
MRIIFQFILTPILTLILGIALGKLINDWPYFIFNYEIKITDVFKILSTIGVGVFIPLLVKKLIDDKRTKNDNIIEVINGFRTSLKSNHSYINDLYTNKKIINKDKDYINMNLDILGKEFDQVHSFLSENCSSKTSTLLGDLKTSYFTYWQVSTSNEVLGSDIKKISAAAFKEICEQYTELNKKIRKLKLEIIKN